MSRWVWPAAAGVVTSATGVAINLATDGRANPWAWVTVVLLTALGVVIALRVQAPAPPPTEPAERSEPTGPAAAEPQPPPQPPTANVHNSISGTVHGAVVQGGNLGPVTVNSPTTINQTAVARDGGTVHQAGRDIRHD
ncbi:hypothetical protein [Saccharothrix luteola]|uniref:hypothetical protein n=1 Tax=Saccharothrix luteola TaxID=2893018 RepID=UPI001E2E71F0|nr:hypothetical protein [Saccharothrix luteola]MCC8248564.1 hypothetical protein [Saccharothrix luteola]